MSVVIPVFNGERFIKQALDSVKAQVVQPCEVIVVNDGSTDETEPMIYHWMYDNDYVVKIFCRSKNKGIGAARRIGALISKGNYLAFLSVDDYWHPCFLAEMMKLVRDDTATFCSYYRCDKQLQVHETYNSPQGDVRENIVAYALKKNMFVNFSGVLIPRSVFSKANFVGFMRYGEDLIFLLDTLVAGLKWQAVCKPLLYYRVHSGAGTFNQTLEKFELLWSFLRCRLKMLGVDDGVIESAYLASRHRVFPPFYRRLVSHAYHAVFGYK